MIQMNKRKKNHCRFTGGSLITMASLAFALLMTMAQQAMALSVAVMPSNSQNPSKGLAQQGVAIEIWGRSWDNNGAISATIDFGDGSSKSTGDVGFTTSGTYIGASHTYTTFGVKTVTLSVTDVDGTVSKTAKVKVLAAPSAEERINMAIEKGLLNLYKTQKVQDANRIYWWSYTDRFAPAITAVALLAFEENGHLPGNTDTEDIYAETVRKGINNLLSNKEGKNANGAYLSYNNDHGTYVNGYAAMAFFLSQPNEQAAKDAVINTPGSIFNGMTYYELGREIVRAFSTNQGTNGAWYYPVTYRSNTLDGSSGQWPILGLLTAKERWGISISQTVADRAYSGFRALQNSNGGIGYRNNRGYNSNRTGGLLIAAALKGIEPKSSADGGNADEDAAYRAIKYIGSQWKSATRGASTGNGAAPFGFFYSFYGVKKGLAVVDVAELFTTSDLGVRDWYKDFSAWALGDRNLWSPDQILPTSAGGGTSRQTITRYFGQKTDGSWDGENGWVYNIAQDTAHVILVLTQAVTVPLPVAIISTIGDAGEVKANEDFDLDGTQSYHQDGDLALVSYEWEINAVGGANNPVATATGATPTIGGLNPGEYQAVLTVTDNNPEEAQTSSDTSTFFAVNKNFGPTSVPIPSGQSAYTAQVVQGGSVTITLDGTESSDPEGDPIVSYNWDLDGDGQYDDATGATPTMTLTSAGSVTIALEVCSQNSYVDALGNTITETQCSTDNAPVLVIYSASDLSVTAISAANIVQGVSADVSATVANNADSGQGFTGVKVRFFDGDPDAGGLALAPAQSVDLPKGGSATVVENGLGLNPSTELVWVKVDWAQGIATGDVEEWDETNNTSTVNVSNQPPVVEWVPQGNLPNFSVGADCLAAIDAAAFYDNANDPDGDQLSITVNPAGPLGLGTHTVTVSVTDGQETISEQYQITVVDITDPVLSVPADVTLECPADTSVAANGTATATDNCSVTVTFVDEVTAACGSTQTIARTWTATDGAGNAVSGLQVIEVVDTTDPVLVDVPADATAECDNVPAPAGVSATDTCDAAPVVVFSEVRTDGASLSDYVLTRTWTATDSCGNSSVASQVITVQDTTDPLLVGVPADATVECDNVPEPAAVSATDICDAAPSVVFSEIRADGASASDYTLTRTWTATDASGNSSVASQVITVQDTTDPVLAGVPADATVECDNVPAPAAVSATDNCDAAPSVVFSEVRTDGNCPSNYILTRTWVATDASGNSSAASQVITVQDTTNPVLVGVPADETVECDSVPAPAVVTATDNCDAPSVVLTEVRTDGNCPSNYTLTRTWVATDACGNQSSATQVVTVQDTTAPAPIVIDLRDIAPNETPITFTSTSSDNCGGVVVTITNVTRHKVNKKGKITFLDEKSGSKSKSGSGSKSKSLPAVVIDGDQVTINDAGGVGTIITVYANAVDECGNSTDGVFTATVVKPSKSNSKSSKSKKSAANEGVGNGVDGNTPGHDNNGGNDDEGNTPGNPGAKEKSESSKSDSKDDKKKKGKK